MTPPIQESVWKQRVPPDPPAPPPILPAFLDSFLGSGGSGGSNLCRVNLIHPNCMKVKACPKSTAPTAPLTSSKCRHLYNIISSDVFVRALLKSTIRTVRLVGRSLLFALGDEEYPFQPIIRRSPAVFMVPSHWVLSGPFPVRVHYSPNPFILTTNILSGGV